MFGDGLARCSLVLFAGLAIVSLPTAAATPTQLVVCPSKGDIVGPFAGVAETRLAVIHASMALRAQLGTYYDGQQVLKTVYYDGPGRHGEKVSPPAVAAVYLQRAAQADRSGLLQTRWEYLWDGVRSDDTYAHFIFSKQPGATETFATLFESIRARYVPAGAKEPARGAFDDVRDALRLSSTQARSFQHSCH